MSRMARFSIRTEYDPECFTLSSLATTAVGPWPLTTSRAGDHPVGARSGGTSRRFFTVSRLATLGANAAQRSKPPFKIRLYWCCGADADLSLPSETPPTTKQASAMKAKATCVGALRDRHAITVSSFRGRMA